MMVDHMKDNQGAKAIRPTCSEVKPAAGYSLINVRERERRLLAAHLLRCC